MNLKKLIIFLLMAQLVYADTIINELMYNPEGNEYDFEYLELYGHGNITNWCFEGIDYCFDNTNIDGYLVVANTCNDTGKNNDLLDRHPGISCEHEYVGSLLNTGETIILRDSEGKIADVVTYGDWAQENHSIERKETTGYSSDPDNWEQSEEGGSPGAPNSQTGTGCDWKTEIITEEVSEEPEFQVRIKKMTGEGQVNMTINKWIENHNKETKQTYEPWNIENTVNQKTSSTYSPNLAEGAYFICANITYCSCNETNLTNNYAEKMIYVIGEGTTGTSNESRIQITDLPSEAEFGDIIKVKIDIYRGDTTKYAVYAHVEDKSGDKVSEKSTIHVRTKYTNYSLAIPIQLDNDCKLEEGKHYVIVEGLGQEEKEKIQINSIKCSTTTTIAATSTSNKPKFGYELISSPTQAETGETIYLEIELQGDEEEHEIEVWSYIYRGSKSYSGEREENKQKIYLKPEGTKTMILTNTVQEPGDYNVKVKIRKDEQKTEKEITTKITIQEPKKTEGTTQTITTQATKTSLIEQNYTSYNPLKIYESSSYKAKNTIPYLAMSITGLFLILMVKKTF